MIENLLKHHSLGSKKQIIYFLRLLEKMGGLPVTDLPLINIHRGIIDLLQCLEIISNENGKIRLTEKNSVQKSLLPLYRSLFQKLKIEKLLYDFLNERNLDYDKRQERVFVKNNSVKLRFSALRNLLIELNLFVKDELLSNQYYIHPDFHKWFCEYVIPDIETSQLADNSLEKLINQQHHQEELGKEAEKFALAYEKKQRKNHHNVENIKIISQLDTNAGYDIHSYMGDDSLLLDKFIEVKSYTGQPYFYWSENEVKVSKMKQERYYLYLIDRNNMCNEGYSPIEIKNPSENLFSSSDWYHHSDGYYFERSLFALRSKKKQ